MKEVNYIDAPMSGEKNAVQVIFNDSESRVYEGKEFVEANRPPDGLSALQIQIGAMMKKLYVGNLSYGATESKIRSLFEQHGKVETVNLITDRDTGRSKGFGFVEMTNDAEAQRAITALNGKEIDGRALTVNEARPKEDRWGGGGGDGRHSRW